MYNSFEFEVLNWIQEHLRSTAMDWFMTNISLLGNSGAIWIVIAAILILWKKHRNCGLMLSAGLISSFLIGNLLLKNIISRPRPCWVIPDINLLIEMPLDYSFPSGHTLSSFISATILFKYDKRMGIPAYILATLIAFSRLYLYVHYPTDILGGIILGILIGLAVSHVYGIIIAKKDDEIKGRSEI